jgi:large subunit ribosomal protein L10e
MASLRAFSCYRRVKRAYTRKSKYRTKSFIKAVPTSKVIKYHFGSHKKEYPVQLDLVSKQRIQIRHNAIESARTSAVRRLSKYLGKNYHFHIRVYPHHVLRENKMLTGAGADRMQTGMQRAFGKAMGIAAQVKEKQAIFTVHCEKSAIPIVRDALKRSVHKLPCKCGIVQAK